jgi:hypothetical protein
MYLRAEAITAELRERLADTTGQHDRWQQAQAVPPADGRPARAGRRYDDPMVEKDKKLVPGI